MTAEARVRRLVAAAARLSDASDPLGRRARAELPQATGLSPANVALALDEILETRPPDDEIATLLASVEPAPRAHVVLSANVFVAAHRAIALGLAQSEHVLVRPSRREPLFASLLREASSGAFEIVSELRAVAGEHVWAYGSDESLSEIRSGLPRDVVFHAHGSGFGIAFVEAATVELDAAAEALARDVVPFDQRGCLSPRLAVVDGTEAEVRAFAAALARALAALEKAIPQGTLDRDELAAIARWRDTVLYASELVAAGSGWVSLGLAAEPLLLPPVGRLVAVTRATPADPRLASLERFVAAAGIGGSEGFGERVKRRLPHARSSPLGRMQRPTFDGPVDRRPPLAELH
jgi:hypothetical protein